MRALLAIVLIWPALASAQTAYVTDNLRLGLHAAEDTSDRAFRTLESGQALEVLSRNVNYAHVALPDGTEGYVKAAYLVDDKPAKLIVAETQAESDALRGELATLREQFAGPAATIASLEQKTAELEVTVENNQARMAELTDENTSLREQSASAQRSVPLSWVGGATLVTLVLGFLLGLWWVDRRIRQRHGDIRIY
ncbi:MAG: TIGR04211 family SH3 domain-containing protein [Pseudomonadota bacterium]